MAYIAVVSCDQAIQDASRLVQYSYYLDCSASLHRVLKRTCEFGSQEIIYDRLYTLMNCAARQASFFLYIFIITLHNALDMLLITGHLLDSPSILVTCPTVILLHSNSPTLASHPYRVLTLAQSDVGRRVLQSSVPFWAAIRPFLDAHLGEAPKACGGR